MNRQHSFMIGVGISLLAACVAVIGMQKTRNDLMAFSQKVHDMNAARRDQSEKLHYRVNDLEKQVRRLQQREIDCSECNGKGEVTYDGTEEVFPGSKMRQPKGTWQCWACQGSGKLIEEIR